jgi:phosphoribosylamine--glycine ligase
VPMASAQDHKRVGDGDTGPNTGGMGAYSPAPALSPDLERRVMETIIYPTVKGMHAEGCKYLGVLYAGVIIEKKNGLPKLLEYNVRFGDPECQVLMMRLQSDLVQVLLSACKGGLQGVQLEWAEDPALVVVMAANGYPGKYVSGTRIQNLDVAEVAAPGVKIFHAGTTMNSENNLVSAGGRVLGVTAVGKDIAEAQGCWRLVLCSTTQKNQDFFFFCFLLRMCGGMSCMGLLLTMAMWRCFNDPHETAVENTLPSCAREY